MTSKVVVVSGANGTIGRILVKTLLSRNYIVAACVRDVNVLELEVAENLYFYECDFDQEHSIKACTAKIKKDFKIIFAIVNCTGTAFGAGALMTTAADLMKVFKINYFSIVLFTQQLVKKMIKPRSGVIINLTSTAGILDDSGTMAYGGSKAALIHTTKVMAKEFGSFNIRVNAIAPAVVESPMAELMSDSSMADLDSRASLKSKIYPDEIVDLIIYLLSDSSKNITGQIIKVDRGISA